MDIIIFVGVGVLILGAIFRKKFAAGLGLGLAAGGLWAELALLHALGLW